MCVSCVHPGLNTCDGSGSPHLIYLTFIVQLKLYLHTIEILKKTFNDLFLAYSCFYLWTILVNFHLKFIFQISVLVAGLTQYPLQFVPFNMVQSWHWVFSPEFTTTMRVIWKCHILMYSPLIFNFHHSLRTQSKVKCNYPSLSEVTSVLIRKAEG